MEISNNFKETILLYLESNTNELTGLNDNKWFCSYYLLGANKTKLYLKIEKATVEENGTIDNAVNIVIILRYNKYNNIISHDFGGNTIDDSKFIKSLPEVIKQKLINQNEINKKLEEELLSRAQKYWR